MHTFIEESDGWTIEYLRDDTDMGAYTSLQHLAIGVRGLYHEARSALTKIKTGDIRIPSLEDVLSFWQGLTLQIEGLPDTVETLDDLQGCSIIKAVKEGNGYRAEIRFEEQQRNNSIVVEANVFPLDGKCDELDEKPQAKVYERLFSSFNLGDRCKPLAAAYVEKLRGRFEAEYFSGE